MNSFFKSFSAFTEEPPTIEDIINQTQGLTPKDKAAIFEYVSTKGEESSRTKKEFVTNLIIIFNSFFEYGFTRGLGSSSSGHMRSGSPADDEWADSHDSSNPLTRVTHYWEYMTIQFSELESVRYINFYYEDASTNREKALGWILLALTQKKELKRVFLEIFCSIPILQLYSKEDSYLWSNRKEVLEAADFVAKKDLYSACPLLERFGEFLQRKTASDTRALIILGDQQPTA